MQHTLYLQVSVYMCTQGSVLFVPCASHDLIACDQTMLGFTLPVIMHISVHGGDHSLFLAGLVAGHGEPVW